MTAAPKAMSHGDGSAAGALTALTGMSAASAGAAENASAATTDKTTFFIDPAPFRFDRLSADTIRPSLLRTRTRLQPTGPQIDVHYPQIYIFDPVPRQAKNDGNCCLFRRFRLLLLERNVLLRQSHNFRACNSILYRNPGRRRPIGLCCRQSCE